MFSNKSSEQSSNLVEQAVQSADSAIKSTQRVANNALENLSETVKDMRDQAGPMLNRASEQASSLVHRGVDGVHHASDKSINFIKQEPVKSILIAAATGAALMALVSLMSRSHSRG